MVSELTDSDTASQSPCGWKGVTCDNVTFEVTSLDLSGNNMTGLIPVELCNCTSLTHLKLSGQTSFRDPFLPHFQAFQICDASMFMITSFRGHYRRALETAHHSNLDLRCPLLLHSPQHLE